MSEPSGQLQLPRELKDVILSKKCVAFIGSGLSSGCYPSWSKLVHALCERCGSPHSVHEDSPACDLLDAAQDAKNRAKNQYFSFLGETFGRDGDSATIRRYNSLLALPFHSYLSINFDPLLFLWAPRVRPPCSMAKKFPDLDRKDMVNRSIHYLHGLIEQGVTPTDGDIVLARDEFDAAYSDNSVLVSLLASTLRNDPIVFIGCSLREHVWERISDIYKNQQRELREYFRRQNIPRKPPPRFILAPMPEMNRKEGGQPDEALSREVPQDEDARYRSMDIIPVWYRVSGSDHSQLWDAIEQLAGIPPLKVS